MFRFTIRDVLWLTVVVAVSLGWWVDQNRLARPPVPTREESYQFIMNESHSDKPYLFNPRTGEMWLRHSSGEWTEFSKFPNSRR
jgi:hypothetical protein